MGEDRIETTRKESTAKEEVEGDIGLEAEDSTEEEDEEVVGRILLPLPRRCLRPGRKPNPA